MQINYVEDAYQALAQYLQAFIGLRDWDVACCKMSIYAKMAKGIQWLEKNGNKDEKGGFEHNPNAIWDGLDAALFLRDNLLKSGSGRIWGLTFTLYPDGKFNLEYDYNKPADYEETEDLVTGEEANQSLTKLSKKNI